MDAVRLTFPAESGELKVRILVDQASIEIFGGDGRMWYSKRVLTQVEHPVMFPHCASGTGMIKSLKIYKMNSIWD
jgi:sucrose-6-phosphate hydrolase SacC (GH32 family)